jgi:hypothetical protein
MKTKRALRLMKVAPVSVVIPGMAAGLDHSVVQCTIVDPSANLENLTFRQSVID